MTPTPARRKDVGAAPATAANGAVISSGAFTAKQHTDDTITLRNPAPFTDIADDLPKDVRTLATALAAVYRDTPNRRSMWIADDTFTCDGGALATKLVADRLGIDSTLHVGLYWHSDPELRADIIGFNQFDHSVDEWNTVLESVQDQMDEHHHWATVRASDGVEYVIDPNGPVRGEPHVQPLVTPTRYADGAPHFVYDPREDPTLIADEMYPGLREQVNAAATPPPHTSVS